MPAKSYNFDAQVINFFLRANPGAITSPANVYVALLTAAPNDPSLAGATEVANANGYVRQAVTFGGPTNGVTSNSVAVTFPAAAGGSWGTVVAAAIYDSGTYGAGTCLYYGNLAVSKTISDGDTASFGVGSLSITEQ